MNDKSFMAKEKEVVKRWYVVDAADKILGRLSSEIAKKLRGKDKAIYTPHNDAGDFVVVVNADKVRLTGRKLDQKIYRRYTGFIGGLREVAAKTLLAKKPTELVTRAVRGMLPKNTLGRRQLKKLKVYAGPEHPHARQKPEPLVIKSLEDGKEGR
ncbi:MAG: 50S ribosomal protein L13 [Deltaproteobacteria bacterium]|jgi:large subunit ribosomal protein L13|nr:50S ribosomal protein L13 [Deltaproteobacteria bacterium]